LTKICPERIMQCIKCKNLKKDYEVEKMILKKILDGIMMHSNIRRFIHLYKVELIEQEKYLQKQKIPRRR